MRMRGSNQINNNMFNSIASRTFDDGEVVAVATTAAIP